MQSERNVLTVISGGVKNVGAELEVRILAENGLEQSGFKPAHIHEIVVIINGGIASVPIEYASVICQEILPNRPNVREGFSPELNTDLPLRCDRPSGQTALDNDQGRVRSKLLQAKRRFPLAGLDVRFRELMPVNEDVCARKSGAVRVDAITILEVAFDFEIEFLRVLAFH